MNIDILQQIEADNSRLVKQALLAKVDEETVDILSLTLDPMVTFGVTVDHDHIYGVYRRHEEKLSEQDYWVFFKNLLVKLRDREVTGHAAQRKIEYVLARCYNDPALDFSCRILNKNLRIGIQTSTLNEVFPDSVVEWSIALAETFNPEKMPSLTGNFVREPKLDGLRGVLFNGKMYTRNGRQIESVDHVISQLSLFSDKYVFDGELMGETDFDEDSGKIRKKDSGPNKSITYNVFDAVRVDEWMSRKTRTLRQRKEELTEIFDALEDKSNVKLVEWVELTRNPAAIDIINCGDSYISEGFEGAMIKDLDKPYVFDRSMNILKVKRFFSLEGTIVDFTEGKGRHKGSLGALVVDIDGVNTSVGSGLSDIVRAEIWNDKRFYLGRVVEVKYQNKTKDGRLRFPTFVRFRPDKE